MGQCSRGSDQAIYRRIGVLGAPEFTSNDYLIIQFVGFAKLGHGEGWKRENRNIGAEPGDCPRWFRSITSGNRIKCVYSSKRSSDRLVV